MIIKLNSNTLGPSFWIMSVEDPKDPRHRSRRNPLLRVQRPLIEDTLAFWGSKNYVLNILWEHLVWKSRSEIAAAVYNKLFSYLSKYFLLFANSNSKKPFII